MGGSFSPSSAASSKMPLTSSAMSAEIIPLTKDEIAALAARAQRGDIPTIEEVRRYVASTRASYTAAAGKKAKPKDRTKKPDKKDDRQIDFF